MANQTKKINLKLSLEYNGADFFGSQAQNTSEREVRTVQAELEKAIEIYFKEKVTTTFSGRTDTGVHAIGQVVNFKIDEANIDMNRLQNNPDKILINLNGILPDDIAVVKISQVDDDFHARFDAKSREYLYKIFIRKHKPVLRTDSLTWVKEELDFDAMQKHAEKFLGEQDFSAYAAADNDQDNAICTVTKSELVKESSICFKYKIKANRFLRHMVRKIIAELIEVGKGNEPKHAHTAPAEGLTLMKVSY